MSSEGKIALVTGGGTGVGRAAALALANDGYTVVIVGRRAEPLAETIALAKADNADAESRMLAVPSDISNPEAVDALFAKIKDAYGRIDVVFNNAGVNVPSVPFDELTFDQWKSVVDVNFSGVFLTAQAAFKMMRAQSPQGGRIINNGSISAHVPRPGSAPYTSTKHGVTGLTKTISLDGRPYNIACGQIDIGNALTDMAARMVDGVPQADGSIRSEPVMDVKHVGDAIVHMASLPLDANIFSMTVMATNMPFVGRG